MNRSMTLVTIGAVSALALLAAGRFPFERPVEEPRTTSRVTPVEARSSTAHRRAVSPGVSAAAATTARAPAPSDEVPAVGPVIDVAEEDGTVSHYQALPPGYVHFAETPPTGVREETRTPGRPPPNRHPVDPAAFGFDSYEALEARARRMFRVPPDQTVELWMEEREGKMGLAIDVVPDETDGVEMASVSARPGTGG
jgi:hypothetical protein